MNQQVAADTYFRNSILTAPPEKLTLLLYSGCLRFIRLCKRSIEEQNFEQAHKYNLRAQTIITQLTVGLNMSVPISNQYFSLYSFVREQLIQGNIAKNVHCIETAEEMVQEMKETWEELLKNKKTEGR